MKKYRKLIILIVLPLFLYIGNSFAQEQITGFEGKDLPVLNEELRRIDHEVSAIVPSGTVAMWISDDAPDGWLLCYGQAVSRSTYDGLYNVIGTAYGAGDASTTFNVPDLRGRFPLGQDDMGGTSANVVTDADADTLGGADGDETKDISTGGNVGDTTLTSAQSGVPAHTHPQSATNYIQAGNAIDGGADLGGLGGTTQANTAANAASSHTHTLSAGSATQDFMTPFITINFIIKT